MMDLRRPIFRAIVMTESTMLVRIVLTGHGIDESFIDFSIAIVVRSVANLDVIADIAGAPGV